MDDVILRGRRVVVEPHLLSWAVTAASIYGLEFDHDLARQRLEHELEWGVPLRLTVCGDRLLVGIDAGTDLALAEGVRIPGVRDAQSLSVRFSVPARFTSDLGEGEVLTLLAPADSLREMLHTASRRRAEEQGYFWRETVSREVSLRFTSVEELREEYRREAASTGVAFNEDQWRRTSGLSLARGPLIICSTAGRADTFCPVFDVAVEAIRPGDIEIAPVSGEGVDFAPRRMLAAAFASQSGSDGVLIDPAGRRVAFQSDEGQFVLGMKQARSVALARYDWMEHATVARALEMPIESVRAACIEEGHRVIASAEGQLGHALAESILEFVDGKTLERLVEDLLPAIAYDRFSPTPTQAEREEVLRDTLAEVDAKVDRILAPGRSPRAEDRLRVICHWAAATGASVSDIGREWAMPIGRAHLQTRASREGYPVPLRTLFDVGGGAVVSPRMMFATAFSTLQAESLLPGLLKAEAQRRDMALHVAAAAALADLGEVSRMDLGERLGIALLAKATQSTERDEQAILRASSDIDAVGLGEAAEHLIDCVEAVGLDRARVEVERDRLAPLVQSDLAIATIAAVRILGRESAREEIVDREIGRRLGCARVETEVRRLRPGEDVSGYDFAAALMRIVGRRSEFQADARRALSDIAERAGLPSDPGALVLRLAEALSAGRDLAEVAPNVLWAEDFLTKLRDADGDSQNREIVAAISAHWKAQADQAFVTAGLSRDELEDRFPEIGNLLDFAAVFPAQDILDFAALPEFALARDVTGITRGRLGVDEQYRCHFSVRSPDGRWGVEVCDRAAEPRPEEFMRQIGLGSTAVAERGTARDLARFVVRQEDAVRAANFVADAMDVFDPAGSTQLVVRWRGIRSNPRDEGLEPQRRYLDRTAEGYEIPGSVAASPDGVEGYLELHSFGPFGHEVADLPLISALPVGAPREKLGDVVLTSVIDASWIHNVFASAADAAKTVGVAIAEDGSLAFKAGTALAIRVPPARRRHIPAGTRALIDALELDGIEKWPVMEHITPAQIAAASPSLSVVAEGDESEHSLPDSIDETLPEAWENDEDVYRPAEIEAQVRAAEVYRGGTVFRFADSLRRLVPREAAAEVDTWLAECREELDQAVRTYDQASAGAIMGRLKRRAAQLARKHGFATARDRERQGQVELDGLFASESTPEPATARKRSAPVASTTPPEAGGEQIELGVPSTARRPNHPRPSPAKR